MNEICIDRNELIDELEAVLFTFPQVYSPLIHLFLPGMYIRQIFMPAGTMYTTAIHKTTHPFEVVKGRVNVECNGVIEKLEANYFGITKPGTRRALYVLEDCVWRTFHALPTITGEENDWTEEDQNKLVKSILDEITEWRDNPLLDQKIKDYIIKKKENQLCQLQLLEQQSQP